MGLETSTYISGLTASWPVSGDQKNQGDDHLRLIKGVLQNTFPNATKPVYFPNTQQLSANFNVTAVHQNTTFFCNTSGGAFGIGLPAPGTVGAGFQIVVMRFTGDGNFVNVSYSGGIYTQSSLVPSAVRVGQVMQAATFFTDGGSWFCYKTGGLIGESVSWDSGTIPPGYLFQDGSAFDNTAFQELYQMLGTNVLRDKRNRMELGAGSSYGIGGLYGAGSVTLGTANLPPYTPAGSVGVNASGSVDLPYNGAVGYSAGGGVVAYQRSNANANDAKAVTVTISSANFVGNAQGGSSTAFSIIPPAVGTYKIIRAC